MRVYTILIGYQAGYGYYITFPIKNVVNAFNPAIVEFAGGYPAYFGGRLKPVNTVPDQLAQEVDEESRQTLASAEPYTRILNVNHGGEEYDFFYTSTWETTGLPWHSPRDVDEGEMSTWCTVWCNRIFGDTDEAIAESIFLLSGAPGGSDQQKQEYYNSATCSAFGAIVKLLRGKASQSDDISISSREPPIAPSAGRSHLGDAND